MIYTREFDKSKGSVLFHHKTDDLCVGRGCVYTETIYYYLHIQTNATGEVVCFLIFSYDVFRCTNRELKKK